MIRDEYELIQGEGVEFYWSTRLPVRIDGSEALIRGERGQVHLSFPSGLQPAPGRAADVQRRSPTPDCPAGGGKIGRVERAGDPERVLA